MLKVKAALLTMFFAFAMAGCSQEESSSNTRPLLTIDLTNARAIAISVLGDVEYISELLFDLIAQVDVVTGSPSDLDPFPCTNPSAIDVDYDGPTPIGVSAEYVIDVDGCVFAGIDLDGRITITLDQVNLADDSYGGRIRFSNFIRTTAGGTIDLDGRVDFIGVRVSAGVNAIAIDDSLLTVTKHDGLPANQVQEHYQDLDLFWQLNADDSMEFDIELFVDSEDFNGSLNLITPMDIERAVSGSFPTVGALQFRGTNSSTYTLAANTASDVDLIDHELDSDGNGADISQPADLDWSEVFPASFFIP